MAYVGTSPYSETWRDLIMCPMCVIKHEYDRRQWCMFGLNVLDTRIWRSMKGRSWNLTL